MSHVTDCLSHISNVVGTVHHANAAPNGASQKVSLDSCNSYYPDSELICMHHGR